MDIKLLRSKNLLGLLNDRDLPEIALRALSNVDDKEMLQMALCSKDDFDCIVQAKDALFVREGVIDMSSAEGAEYYAKDICKMIVSGEVDPVNGANQISRVSIFLRDSGSHILDPFVYASSEIPDRPAEREFFVKAIIEEAKSITCSNDLKSQN